MSALGGAGGARGGAGTIYTTANSHSVGQVVIDNGGGAGTNTSLGLMSGPTPDVTIKGGAMLQAAPGSNPMNNLLIASNSWMTFVGQSSSVQVFGNATVQAGGGIIADGNGNVGGQGAGPGLSVSSPYGITGGGGGHGGFGAASSPGSAGGLAYDSVVSPALNGTGGAA